MDIISSVSDKDIETLPKQSDNLITILTIEQKT